APPPASTSNATTTPMMITSFFLLLAGAAAAGILADTMRSPWGWQRAAPARSGGEPIWMAHYWAAGPTIIARIKPQNHGIRGAPAAAGHPSQGLWACRLREFFAAMAVYTSGLVAPVWARFHRTGPCRRAPRAASAYILRA